MVMQGKKKVRIGDLLVENQVITQAQLEQALADQKKTGRKLGRTLIDNGFIGEEQLLQFLSQQLSIPYIDLKHFNFRPEVVALLPEIIARRYRAIVLEDNGDHLLIGMADPTDIFAFDELARTLQRPFKTCVVREGDVLAAFDNSYRRTEEISHLAEELGDELRERDVDLGELGDSDDVTDAPVVKLLQSLFEDAMQVGASDIHIEPDETVLRIRQRVDGVLQEQVMDEKRIAPALVLRLKLMAGLDISEKRLPQDGRFSIKVKTRNVDVRLATMPVYHGESVVMRLLDQSAGVKSLESLGMPEHIETRFRELAADPHGMVLVTGPTGSGKTTTLYATLNILNQPDRKLITVEDPVEYRLERISQVQVNNDIGLSFARVLRTVLRADPDVVLVGEMRDEETAEIGLRAAVTGHMVLSTLHTNDAVSTISRLLDMGAKGYLLASALTGVLAQRLVRRICDQCITDGTVDANTTLWLEAVVGREQAAGMRFKHGEGCSHCNGSGYKGRIGVYELLEMDHELAGTLGHDTPSAFAKLATRRMRGKTLTHQALVMASEGKTTLEEVMRISSSIQEEGDMGDTHAVAAI